MGNCECSDPACPVCHGRCKDPAEMLLFRIDMTDLTGTAFCDPCGDDALGSGLFRDDQTTG